MAVSCNLSHLIALSHLSVKCPFDLPPGGSGVVYPSKLGFSIIVCLSVSPFCGLSSLLSEEGLLPFMFPALRKYLQMSMGGQGSHNWKVIRNLRPGKSLEAVTFPP